MNWTPIALVVGGIAAVIGLMWLATRGGGKPAGPAVAEVATPKMETGKNETRPAIDALKPSEPITTIRQGGATSGGNSGAGVLATNSPAGGVSDPSSGVSAATPVPAGAMPTQASPSAGQSSGSSAGLPGDLNDTISAGRQRMASGDAVGARAMLSRALMDGRLGEADRSLVREDLARISEDLVFSPRIDPADPFSYAYAIQPGDSLIKIDQREKLGPDWRFIQRVNKMSSPGQLSVGRKLKLVRGPFHAVVSKAAFRLDLYMGDSAKPAELVFVRSFKVGLGEAGSTPVGQFRVRPGSKLVNPHWINPRTREKYDANDPKNPIGEHWIGLEGLGQYSTITGYGIHGTIEPDSIGQQRSMGCVRLGAEDIALLYEMLGEGGSTVTINP